MQIALLLLRQINNGSLTYTMRTSCPEVTKIVTASLQGKVTNALASILDCSRESVEAVKDRIFMPIGPGLGLASLPDIAQPAFTGKPPPGHNKTQHTQQC